MSWAGGTFRSLRHLAVATNHPVRDGPNVVKTANLEVRVGQKIRYYRDAIDERIGIGIAEPDVHELDGSGRAVGDERITIMLELHRAGIERSGGWRRDGVVNKCSAARDLNVELERSAGRLTKDTRVEFKDVAGTNDSGKALRKGRALRIVSNAECRRVCRRRRALSNGMDVTGAAYGPVGDDAVRRVRRKFKITIQ